MQILMFDPRENPTATADMLADTGLTGAIERCANAPAARQGRLIGGLTLKVSMALAAVRPGR